MSAIVRKALDACARALVAFIEQRGEQQTVGTLADALKRPTPEKLLSTARMELAVAMAGDPQGEDLERAHRLALAMEAITSAAVAATDDEGTKQRRALVLERLLVNRELPDDISELRETYDALADETDPAVSRLRARWGVA